MMEGPSDEVLETEITLGRDPQYPMQVARLGTTWDAIRHELESLLRDPDICSSPAAAPVKVARSTRLVRFCQIAFAHGQGPQQMAFERDIHQRLVSFSKLDSSLAFSALSNMVTKNSRDGSAVLRFVLLNFEDQFHMVDHGVVEITEEVPLSVVMFLRNAIAACEDNQETLDVLCLDLWKSTLWRACLLRHHRIHTGIIVQGDKEQEDLRELLMERILERLVHREALESWLACIANDGTKASTMSEEHFAARYAVIQFINQYWHSDTAGDERSISIVRSTASALKVWIDQLDQHAFPKSQAALGEASVLSYLLRGMATMVETIEVILTEHNHASFYDILTTLIPTIIKLLGYAQSHFPRAKGGRSERGSASMTDWPVFRNLKRNCIMIIANLSYENRKTQDEVRTLGGIPLVLEQCQIDEMNPYIQEHAVYCIRCLMTNNVENQQMIEQLRPVAMDTAPGLQEMGLHAELDDDGIPQMSSVRFESINDA